MRLDRYFNCDASSSIAPTGGRPPASRPTPNAALPYWRSRIENDRDTLSGRPKSQWRCEKARRRGCAMTDLWALKGHAQSITSRPELKEQAANDSDSITQRLPSRTVRLWDPAGRCARHAMCLATGWAGASRFERAAITDALSCP